MSDEDKDKGYSGSKKKDPADKSRPEPSPTRRDLFEFLESQFYSEPEAAHYPEKIDVRIVSGTRNEKFGPLIKNIPFAPVKATDEAIKAGAGKRKPTREELVALSNEILMRVQKDCDEARRPHVYGVHVWHMSQSDEPFERFLLRCQPKGRYQKDGEPVEDEEDGDTSQLRYYRQVADHHEKMFDLYGTALAGLIDRYDRDSEKKASRIDRQDARIEKLNDMLERALSMEAEREERRQWSALKIHGAQKGLDMGLALLPPLLNGLTGKQIIPTNESAESITLKNFFKSLSQAQMDAVFGVYDEQKKAISVPGVLTLEQGQLLYAVKECQAPASELNELMPGGRLGITQEQVTALQARCGLDLEQMAPLMLIFQNLQHAREQKS